MSSENRSNLFAHAVLIPVMVAIPLKFTDALTYSWWVIILFCIGYPILMFLGFFISELRGISWWNPYKIKRDFDRDVLNGTLCFYVAIIPDSCPQPLWAKDEKEVWNKYSEDLGYNVTKVYETTENEYFRCHLTSEHPRTLQSLRRADKVGMVIS